MLMIGMTAASQPFERNRSVRESFQAPAEAEIQVINKYGDVYLIPWEKDSVRFEIEFSIVSSNLAKVEKINDYVDFSFRATNYYIIAQTMFKGQNTFWTEMADIANIIFSGGTQTKIDYTVYYPMKNDIRIENKFGNIYTTDIDGKSDITLSNGDIKAHSFNGQTKLKLEFGSADINLIRNGSLSVSYSEFNLEQAEELVIESKSSKIYLTKCNLLQINSRRDRYYLKEVEEIGGETFFSYINLDAVAKKINLKTSYGDIQIQALSTQFQHIELNSECTDINLFFDPQYFYEIEVQRDDRTEMVFSSGLLTKKETRLDTEGKVFKVECTGGTAGKYTIPVNINAKAGKIYLMNK